MKKSTEIGLLFGLSLLTYGVFILLGKVLVEFIFVAEYWRAPGTGIGALFTLSGIVIAWGCSFLITYPWKWHDDDLSAICVWAAGLAGMSTYAAYTYGMSGGILTTMWLIPFGAGVVIATIMWDIYTALDQKQPSKK